MRLRHGIAFGVFSLFVSSHWLVDAQWPGTLPPLLTQSLHYAVASAVILPLLPLKKIELKTSWPNFLHISFASLLLLGAPALLQQFAGAVSPDTSVSLYAMVPLWVVLGIATMNNEGSRALLMPALAGLAGLLLLLHWQVPSSATGVFGFGLVAVGVLLTAIGSVWMHKLTRDRSRLNAAVVIAMSNAMVLGCVGLVRGERISNVASTDFIAMLVDVPQFLMLIWLVCELTPEQVASRFLLVPLVTLLEGVVMLSAPLDARMVMGILLLLFGAGSLLFGERESTVSLGLR